MKHFKIIAVILNLTLLCLTISSKAEASQELASHIKNNPKVSCFWVRDVGDSNPATDVSFVEMGGACSVEQNSGKDITARGICKGIIKCTGLQGVWNEVYFEDVHCPGNISLGTLNCGRSGKSNARNGKLSEGVKSCISDFLINKDSVGGDVQGGGRSIKQVPSIKGVVQ